MFDETTIRNGLNFTLTSKRLGDLDLLGEVAGGGTYEQLLPFTTELTVFGHTCRCVTLERLIQLKRAAGRPKDFEAIAELELATPFRAPPNVFHWFHPSIARDLARVLSSTHVVLRGRSRVERDAVLTVIASTVRSVTRCGRSAALGGV